jgi:hypothetical protein
MTKQTKIPPLKRVYWTAELKKVAIARLQGGISWAELILVNDSVGLQQGVLLFDTLESATAYIKRKAEDFAVVVELPIAAVEKELLVRCQEFSGSEFKGEFRQWIYPNHIWFDAVKFHKIETVTEQQELPKPDFSTIMQHAIPQVKLVGDLQPPTTLVTGDNGIITVSTQL